MKRTRVVLLLLAACLAGRGVSGQAPAGQSPPRVGYVYPAGGQQGTTVRVLVGGQFLDGVSDVLISGRELRASVVDHDKPLNARQITELRERAQALQTKAAADPSARTELLDIRARIADTQRRNRNPTLSEIVTLEVTIGAQAEPGLRELRLRAQAGVSSPVRFAVGQLPEVREPDADAVAQADSPLLSLPVTVNGRIIPRAADGRLLSQPGQNVSGDVDRYRFSARKGQHLVIAASARDLIPYLADAVPGWFQAVVTLYDASGREVAFCDDYRFRPDPVLHYQVPADGDYTVEVRDAIDRGREDFVYRLAIGELPFITHVFPLGGREGEVTPVELAGWNLPSDRALVPRRDLSGAAFLSVTTGGLESNRVPFSWDALPAIVEAEPNDRLAAAQRVSWPTIVDGRIQQAGESDVFGFTTRAGDTVVVDVLARRLESPLDSVVELLDAAGNRLAFNDDQEDRAAGQMTHHADSYIRFTLARGGTYFVRVGDRQQKGGAEYGYRLRLSAPRPDFELRVSPSSVTALGAANVPVTVTAIRRDGFTGAIALELHNAPVGTVVSGGVIPADQDRVRITITPPPRPSRDPERVRLEGRAVIQGRTIVHEAVPSDDRTQAFAYHHLVATEDLLLSVSGRGGTQVPARVTSTMPVKISAGGRARLRVSLPPAFGAFQSIQFDLSDPPEGLAIARDGEEPFAFVIQARATAVPGLRGNLIVLVSGERVPRGDTQPNATRRRIVLGALPAIPFEILPARK